MKNLLNLENPRIKLAYEFANHNHEAVGQRRKYTGEPYIIHPASVAKMVATVNGTENMIIAALLHDTVEDTKATLAEIRQLFGEEVANMVEALTDSPKSAGNRKTRKQLDRDRLAAATGEIQTIKLADLIDNTQSIVDNDPQFAPQYLQEKELLLAVLTKGHKTMRDVARYTLANAKEKCNPKGLAK